MFWALSPIMCSIPGASCSLLAVPPPRLRRAFPRPLGDACRPVKETRDPRLHDWTYVELADLQASEYNDTLGGEWTRGLLIRQHRQW